MKGVRELQKTYCEELGVCLSVIIFCLLIDGTIPFETHSVRQEHLKMNKRKVPGIGVERLSVLLV